MSMYGRFLNALEPRILQRKKPLEIGAVLHPREARSPRHLHPSESIGEGVVGSNLSTL